MNVVLRQRMTVAEFLAWEEAQVERWEFDGFAPVALVGATLAHNLIVSNVSRELYQRLRGGPCRVFQEVVKVQVAGSVRYPDVLVACGPNLLTATVADNPVVVFEVLSPGTARVDVLDKTREYQATLSIQRYVILAQDGIAATVYARRREEWLATSMTEGGEMLEMPEIGVTLPLAALYAGVIE